MINRSRLKSTAIEKNFHLRQKMCLLEILHIFFTQFYYGVWLERKIRKNWKILLRICATEPWIIDEEPPHDFYDDEIVVCGHQAQFQPIFDDHVRCKVTADKAASSK